MVYHVSLTYETFPAKAMTSAHTALKKGEMVHLVSSEF